MKRFFLSVVFFWIICLVFIINSRVFACSYSSLCGNSTFSCFCTYDDNGNVRYCIESSGGTEGCPGTFGQIYVWDFWGGSDCSCGSSGSTTDANISGAVTVEGITPAGPPPASASDPSRWTYVRPADGITGYAGPDGHVQVYGGGVLDPLKGYCDSNFQWCCGRPGNEPCDNTCARGCGDYMEGNCAGENFVSHGVTGTSNLTVTADSVTNPVWTTKIRYGGKTSGSDLQCSSLANDTGTCGDGACTSLSRGPFFSFGTVGRQGESHTFTINTTNTDGYVPASMSLTGATTASVTCDGYSTVCSLTATFNAGSHYLAIVIKKPPTGVVYGSVKNITTNINIKDAANAVCSGEAQSGFSVSANGDTGAGLTSCFISSSPTKPYFTKTLNAGTAYDLTASLPVGWRAIDWEVYQCNEAPTIDWCTPLAGSTRFGTGSTITNVVVNSGKQTMVNFRAERIPPTCQISGPNSVPLGSNWVGSVTANVPGSATAPVAVEGAWSSTLTLGTRLGYLGGTGSVTTPISWTPADTNVGNTYNFYCRGWNDAIRECRPFAYGAYPADVDCFNGTKNSTCLGTGTDCLPVQVTDTTAWFQVQGGDTHAQTGITSFVPTTATNPLFNLNLDLFPGLISYASPYTFDFSAIPLDDGISFSSSKTWLTQSGFSSPISSFYANYLDKLKNNIAAGVFDCKGPHNYSNQGVKVYSVTGDCNIDANWSVSGNSKIVVLVSGNLNLSGNSTNVSVDPGAFLSFVVAQDLDVNNNLGNKQLANDPIIEGVYLVDGTINTSFQANPSDPNSGNRFIGGGTFYGKGGFSLGRDLKPNGCSGHACNAYTPSESFVFRPDLVVNAPYEMWSSKIDWQEVVP